MDRRNFFKACAGVVAGVVAVLLPAKALKAEIVPCMNCDCDDGPVSYIHYLELTREELAFEEKRPIDLDKVRAAYLVSEDGGYILRGEFKQDLIDWAKGIRREEIRQRHKVG